MIITEKIFKQYHRACVDFYNWVINNDSYDYDSQSFEYHHLQTILNEHFPNDSLSIKHFFIYFTNKGVLIGLAPISDNGVWTARAISHNKSLICNDFNGWKEAHDKCIEYGFELLNEILLSTNSQDEAN